MDHVHVNTAPYNVVAPPIGQEFFVLVDTSSILWPIGGDVVLPAAPNPNTLINVKDVGGNAAVKSIDIQGNGILIEGVATLPVTVNGANFRLFFDGVAWWIV